MSVSDFSYIHGDIGEYDLPLSNFIPPLPKNVLTRWIEGFNLSKHVLIDPISANPMLPVELAANGYRILSARSNPIIWLMSEVFASAPAEEDISRAINKLFLTRFGNGNLSSHLQEIYATPCANCGKVIQAKGFIWDKNHPLPTARVYHCKSCADEGEREITDFDLQNLARLGKLGMHRSRAFQRVGSGTDYEQVSLNTALDCYLPRALYVCMLLVNRLEMLNLDKKEAQYLRAVLLTVFNDAHSLRYWPLRRYRFLQLSVPSRFFENNLFLSLSNAAHLWTRQQLPVKVSYWPNLPDEGGGVCFFQRQLAETRTLVPENNPTAVPVLFPRPGQAFWTLSALWAAWLWGRKAVRPMRSALGRRRYDWYWYAKAIHIAIRRITSSVGAGSPIFGILPGYTPGLTFGMSIGMVTAGFKLTGAAYRASNGILQCTWKKQQKRKFDTASEIDFKKIITGYLLSRGEPVDYHHLLMEVILKSAAQNGLVADIETLDDAEFTRLQNMIKRLLETEGFLESLPSEQAGGSKYWLINDRDASTPLSEAVETSIRDILLSKDEIHLNGIYDYISRHFSGNQTPELNLVDTILKSYADPSQKDPFVFRLCKNEQQDARNRDVHEINEILQSIGVRLNQKINDSLPITWVDPTTNTRSYIFYPLITSAFSQLVLEAVKDDQTENVIVFPASRSALIYYRLQRDPRLAAAVENGWHFLKFRFLRRLAKKADLDMRSWKEYLDSDPPLWDPPTQLAMI